ncbi:MAG: GNA1162 family protein [bacterium]
MRNILKKSKCLFLAIIIFGFGCAHMPKNNPANPIRKVAVLPMVNNTSDMDGPELVRKGFNKLVRSKYYEVMGIPQIDEILRDRMGITLGGQLGLTNAQKLGEELGVDGVVYGELLDFNYTITGFYNSKVVRAKFKLVSTKTGDTVWEREEKVQKSEISFNSKNALESFKGNLSSKIISKAVRISPLQGETNELVYKFYSTFPAGPVGVGK